VKLLAIAPHPDDEALGCGGTLLRLKRERPEAELHWAIVTNMAEGPGFDAARVAEREREIAAVANMLRVTAVHRMGFPAARLDTVPQSDLVGAFGVLMKEVEPDTVFVPHRNDVHTDHRYVFDAASSCVKSFRYPSVRRVLSYETLSETEFAIDPAVRPFQPNVWIDISDDLDDKLALLGLYGDEMGTFPFPRSREAVEALARLRGSTAGCRAAEAFMLLKSLI